MHNIISNIITWASVFHLIADIIIAILQCTPHYALNYHWFASWDAISDSDNSSIGLGLSYIANLIVIVQYFLRMSAESETMVRINKE